MGSDINPKEESNYGSIQAEVSESEPLKAVVRWHRAKQILIFLVMTRHIKFS
jgi:hypothetical protein